MEWKLKMEMVLSKDNLEFQDKQTKEKGILIDSLLDPFNLVYYTVMICKR